MYITPVEAIFFFYDLVSCSDGMRYGDEEWLRIVAAEGGCAFEILFKGDYLFIEWYENNKIIFAERFQAVQKWARWAR